MDSALIADLRRWADARDRRYNENHQHGAHGLTGTAKLRAAADVIEEQDREIARLRDVLERAYQVGRGPHVAIAREGLNA